MQPFEVIKVRPVNQSLAKPQYEGIVHCFFRILKEEGWKSFYRAHFFPCWASVFKAPWSLGPMRFSNSWLLTYLVDYVKTTMQSQPLQKLKYGSSWGCAVERYRAQGYKTFFKGLGITMLRQFLVNGAAFFSFEFVMRRMGWKKE